MIGPISIGRTVNFWWWSVSRIRIPDHFSTFLTVAEWGILGDLLAFLIQSPADFHDTRRNDWRRQDNESTTFWQRSGKHSDPNQISPEIWIRIPDQLLVELLALAEVCALWALSRYVLLSALSVTSWVGWSLVTRMYCDETAVVQSRDGAITNIH